MLSGSPLSTRKVVWGSHRVTHTSPSVPLCMVGHITISSNTTMNHLPAQHHLGRGQPPTKAPRGAS
eukprot:7283414-Prymnesium_polylepis.1